MIDENESEIRIPIIEEQVSIEKRMVTSGTVRISKTVEESSEPVSALLSSESYEVQRVPKDELVDQPPQPVQHYDDRIVISVLEERPVVEKKLFLVEEIHLIRKEVKSEFTDSVTVKREVVSVERKTTDEGKGIDEEIIKQAKLKSYGTDSNRNF